MVINVAYHVYLAFVLEKLILLSDLSKNVINVGKTKACDICLQVEEVSAPVWNVVSREHFTIVRTCVEDQWGISYKVQLKDLSMNGTYINGVNVGKGNTRSLKDDSVIALGRSQNEGKKCNLFSHKAPCMTA